MVETEAERNRLLARSSGQTEWRSDTTTPTQKARILSAHGRRDPGMVACRVQCFPWVMTYMELFQGFKLIHCIEGLGGG